MNKVPNLRFKEFSGKWEKIKLGDKCTFYSGGTPLTTNKKYYDGNIPFIRSAEISSTSTELNISEDGLNNSSAKMVKKGDLLYALYGATSGEVSISKIDGAINQAILCIQSDRLNLLFLEKILRKNKDNIINTYLQGGQGNLSSKIVQDLRYYFPSLEEQEKIAAFFSLIDKKIALQTEKVEELKNYKKGLMQKIFSQELRFKDENGNEYPEWEEKTLQQIGFTYAGLSGKTKEDFGFGNGSFVTYINVFRNTLAKRMIEQVNISEQENQNPVLKGDLLFTTSSETPNEVGMVSCWDYEIKNLYLNSFCFGYRIYNHNSYSPIFLAYMLRSGEYRKKISILAQGSTRYNISKTELMKMKVQCPCMEEQQKIVALLLNLELKTEEEQNKLNELLQYKKGLLQQMFI